MRRLYLALWPLVAASAAFAQSEPVPGSRDVTPPGFQLPGGSGCAAEISRYRAVQDNDLAMGNVAQSVYNRIKAEIAAAERECSAGQDTRAVEMLDASKQRHGYPAGL